MGELSRSSGPAQRYQLLDIADAIGRSLELSLADEQSFEAVVGEVTSLLREVRENPIAIHGRRVESMFGYVVASLGSSEVVKKEDAGTLFHPKEDTVLLPDYRVILQDGTQLLIEVKNIHEENPKKRFKIRRKDVERMARYATACRCEFRLAIYWSRWRQWSLRPEDLLQGATHHSIDLLQALKVSRMGELGEILIGTTSPLVVRVETDHNEPRDVNETGQVAFTIGAVRVFAGETEIVDPSERSFALYLYQYGDWIERDPTANVEGGKLISIDFSAAPAEPVVGQGFDFLGPVSRMISNQYTELTTSDGLVSRLSPPVAPSALRAAVPGRVDNLTMPLWVFHPVVN